MRKKQNQNGVKILIIGVILVCLVLGYYFYLSQKAASRKQESEVKITEVQNALLRNLDTNYPPTPREVLKCYCQMAQCLYNETYTEEEFKELALKIQTLYDAELVANTTQDQYLQALKWDIEQFTKEKIVISSYTLSSATDVEEFKQDGYSWAKLYCTFTLRTGTQLSSTQEVFLLRKDEENHWKIYGWELVEQ
ncbi:MAG: hypothetical protein OSJ60_06685 [Lachnospiraceae bacterium]|nr:hypothetical protein C819_01833 [Lachnospiraceae bacterium 10-1]MCX4351308.1 hypothetical protein [Lachnospiraceae bacterium]